MTFLLANEHSFIDMLYCHIMNMKQVLCILCNTIMLLFAHCFQKCHCGSTIIEAPEHEHSFPFLPYARTRSCQSPVCVVFGRPYYLYSRWQSTPVFVKRRISTRRCESFGMFAERSKCYSCLSSVRARGCCLLFRVFITACASQDGVFRLREAENPCLLSLQEELHGNRTMFGGRGILSYQSRRSEVPSPLQGDWQYFLQTRNGLGIKSYSEHM